MTREQLRAALLSGADSIRNSPIWRFMSEQQRNLSVSTRQFWAVDNTVTDAALDAVNANMSTMQSLPQAAPPVPADALAGLQMEVRMVLNWLENVDQELTNLQQSTP